MKGDWKLKCTACGEEFDYDFALKLCPGCDGGLTIELGIGRGYGGAEAMAGAFLSDEDGPGIWTHASRLPPTRARVSLGEANTPLHVGTNLARSLAIENLYLKDETVEPTGSYLDRSSALFVSVAIDNGYGAIHAYTTGNLGASLSAYSAKASLKLRVVMKNPMDPVKLYQMIAYGAAVHVEEELGEKFVVAAEYDPLITFAKRTIAFEIVRQLKQAPDYIIMPMGEGGLLYETSIVLKEAGFQGTKLVGVQAEGCAPIVEAFVSGSNHVREAALTKSMVFDLSVLTPRYGDAALRAIRESEGTALSISEHEIVDSTMVLAEGEGLLAEPAASLGIAALEKLRESLRGKKVVCVLTGSGLKDPRIMKEIASRKSSLSLLGEEGIAALKGTKAAILKLLYERDMYGYEIWVGLKARGGANFSMASIYQHLSELAAQGYLQRGERKKIRGRQRQYYVITQKGQYAIG